MNNGMNGLQDRQAKAHVAEQSRQLTNGNTPDLETKLSKLQQKVDSAKKIAETLDSGLDQEFQEIEMMLADLSPEELVEYKAIETKVENAKKERVELKAGFSQDIEKALDEKFIYWQSIAKLMALGIVTKTPVLMWGPPGYGKSEMTMEALKSIFEQEDIFVQSFSTDMTESRLFGGVDIKVLQESGKQVFLVENSFIKYRVVIFEEIFQAPPELLKSLKDLITSKSLRNGTQQEKMECEIIIGLTNKQPSEIADMGDDEKAIIERFPLQLNVAWESHEAKDYLALFKKVIPVAFPQGPDLNNMAPILAEVLAKIAKTNTPISPRTAVHCLRAIQGAATLRGSESVEKEDLLVLEFIDGLTEFAKTIQTEIEQATERASAEERYKKAETALNDLTWGVEQEKTKKTPSPITFLQIAKSLSDFIDALSVMKVTNDLKDKKKTLADAADARMAECKQLSESSTRQDTSAPAYNFE
jgi:hypothetical protein